MRAEITRFYLPTIGIPYDRVVFGPGELRPSWVKVSYRRDKEDHSLSGVASAEVELRPRFAQLTLEHHENNYRHMFEMPDNLTHYFIPTEPTYDEYRAFYDELAPQWAEFSQAHSHDQFGDWIIARLDRLHVPKDAKILAIEKGIGELAQQLSESGYTNMTLFTISEKMAEEAKRHHTVDSSAIFWGDYVDLARAGAGFDAVISAQRLQYANPYLRYVWPHIVQSLNPEGILVSCDIYPLDAADTVFREVAHEHEEMLIGGERTRRMTLNVFTGLR